MCEEESDDSEAVRKLLEINDSIHRTIERYRLVKKGDVDGASRIPKGTLGTTTGVSKNANNELSLIDFDPEPTPSAGGSQQAAAAAPAQGGSSLENDLLGLSMDGQVPSGGISLGPSRLHLDGFVEGILTCLPAVPSTNPLNQLTSPAPPVQQAPVSSQPNYDILSSLNSPQSTSPVPNSIPGFSQPPQPQLQQTTIADPFASLIPGGPRGSSPFSPAVSQTPPATTRSGTPAWPAAQGSAEEDEWNFTSSLPESSALPSTNKVAVLDSSLRIEFVARRHPTQPRQIHIVGLFSNRTSQPIRELHFQVAVEKVTQ